MPRKETRPGPHHFSAPELKKVGVRILERKNNIWFQCETCGGTWSPALRTEGKLPRGYWKCPYHSCNAPA
jgi:hypothetical protein